MRKLYYFAAIVLSLYSCQNSGNRLRDALRLAGDNRGELEKVLEHYANDSLKLRAAVFLIENMPGHYTAEGKGLDNLRETFNKERPELYFSNKYISTVAPFYRPDLEESRKEDVEHITSEFLIGHIDAAIEQYNNYPWLSNFPFDTFLEYLLPYRFTNEPLDYWRDSLHMTDKQVEMIRYYDDIKYLPAKITDFYLPQNMRLHDKSFINTMIRGNTYDDCYSLVMREFIKCKALGIPSAIDFMPGYGNRNGYHYWVTYMSPEVKVPEKRWLPERKAPKIYRITYSPNNIHKGRKGEYIPELFRNPFIKDITNLYASTKDISIKNTRKLTTRPNYAYLCVFNNLGWLPVAIGKYRSKSVEFENVGEDLVYLPISYYGEDMIALNYPFILYRDGKIKYLEPDVNNKQKIVLTRKYPSNMTVVGMIKAVNASYWSASNNLNFSSTDTMFTYRASGYLLETECKNKDHTKAYRYWKFTPAQSSLDIAEFIFLDVNGKTINIPAMNSHANLFDNNPLTNFRVEEEFIVDLGADTAISKIICIPRTDANGIIPGNNYELFYFDLGGWQSLGKRTATDTWLEYDNVPQGALLWLRNHTTGVEERTFTYEDGKVRWW